MRFKLSKGSMRTRFSPDNPPFHDFSVKMGTFGKNFVRLSRSPRSDVKLDKIRRRSRAEDYVIRLIRETTRAVPMENLGEATGPVRRFPDFPPE